LPFYLYANDNQYDARASMRGARASLSGATKSKAYLEASSLVQVVNDILRGYTNTYLNQELVPECPELYQLLISSIWC
jgi:hypothetical protein